MKTTTSLYALLERPEPFKRSAIPFWNEPHISEHLLAAHLDPEFEGASRNAGFIDRSVDWIAATLSPERHPHLLDVGCGPGLYAARLHDRGYRVTGIDFSRRSIDYAVRRAEETGRAIEYRYGNYLELEDSGVFDAAVMIYCDYGALSPAEGATLLRSLHRSLRPGGKVLLDVFTPAKQAAFRERRVWEFHEDGGFWRAGPHFTVQADLLYDDSTTLEHTVVVGQEDSQAYFIWNRYFTPESLGRELAHAGFRNPAFFDDVAGRLLSDGSQTLAVIAEK